MLALAAVNDDALVRITAHVSPLKRPCSLLIVMFQKVPEGPLSKWEILGDDQYRWQCRSSIGQTSPYDCAEI